MAWTESKSDLELFFDLLRPGPGEKVLDIGAGDGTVAGRVAGASGCEMFAVDPAKRKVASMKRNHPQIRGTLAGSEKLPFDDSYFDRAYTTMALHHFSDLDRALSEIGRVLKGGGTFVVLEVEPSSKRGVLFRILENAIMRKHMEFMTQDRLVERIRGSEAFVVEQTRRGAAGYFVQCSKK